MTSCRRTVRSIGAVVLVSALVACGSSGSKSTATTGAKTATTTTKSTTTTSDANATTEAGRSGSTSPSSTPPTVTARGGGKFCQQIATSYNTALGQSSAASTPAALRKSLDEGQKKSQEVLDSAPGEIKPYLRTIYAASNALIAALKKVGYDVTKVPPTASAAFSNRTVAAATTRVLAFVRKQCGIDLGGASGSTTVP